MAAAQTYTPIATTTLGSNAATITFSSIPSTYTDLILVLNGSPTSSSNLYARFNGDSGANYSGTQLYGTGSAAGSARDSGSNVGYIADIYSNQVNITHFMNYSNTTTYKTVIGRSNGPANVISANVVLWRSTAAINQIVLSLLSTYQFTTGTTATLYGIAAA